jgi:hypothetical protein
MNQTQPELSTTEYRLLQALHYNGVSSISFHGPDTTSYQDLKGLIIRELGWTECEYSDYREAADSLIAKGLANWSGNRWLDSTESGTALYEVLFAEF